MRHMRCPNTGTLPRARMVEPREPGSNPLDGLMGFMGANAGHWELIRGGVVRVGFSSGVPTGHSTCLRFSPAALASAIPSIANCGVSPKAFERASL